MAQRLKTIGRKIYLPLFALLTLCAATVAHGATVFGIVCSKGSACQNYLPTVAAETGATAIRVNLPILIGLTDLSTNTTAYPSGTQSIQNTIAGSLGSGALNDGTSSGTPDQLLQDNTNAAAQVAVTYTSGASVTVGFIGQPGGNPPNATDTWRVTNGPRQSSNYRKTASG